MTLDFPKRHFKKSGTCKQLQNCLRTLRPLRSSSLWMAMPDTHLEAPPFLALARERRASRSVAPWSLWKGSCTRSKRKRFKSRFTLSLG